MYTIMVIDDSPFIVDIFVTMLQRGGYQTVAAYGGQEALELLQTVKPDLILLDIMMEPMDGWETLMRIKNDQKSRDIPVMMLTAKQLTPNEAQEYGIYIEDYIMKPVTHKELYEAIEAQLNRRRVMEKDLQMARDAGVDESVIQNYRRLWRSIDINKRLLKILENTYRMSEGREEGEDDFSMAIRNMEMNVRFQEEQLNSLRNTFMNRTAPV
jgi:CheY-like chemotaxis protein